MKLCFLVLLTTILLCPIKAFAQEILISQQSEEPITIAGTAWGITLDMDNTGVFYDLLNETLSRIDTLVNYTPLPFARAAQNFARGKSDCLYSMSIRTFVDTYPEYEGMDLIESQIITEQTSYIFASRGIPVIRTLDEIRGKKIAMILGETYDEYLADYGGEWFTVNDEESRMNMLLRGRIDYVVGYFPDAFIHFRNLNVEPFAYDPNLVLYEAKDGITCYNTTRNQEFLTAVDTVFTEMKQSGVVSQIYGNHGVDYSSRE